MRAVEGTIERIITAIPAPHTRPVDNPDDAAASIARSAAKRAALLSGSLALPPGPLGLLTVLPDIYLIWQTQRQMVADIFALYGRSAELTRTHMLYCLFRHAASQVLRDVAVRTGQRVVVRQLTGPALSSMLGSVGASVTQRMAGAAAGRWVPVVGALAVGGYAYWDTLQVAKTARGLLGPRFPVRRPVHRPADPRCAAATSCTPIRRRSRWRSGLLEPPDARPRYNIAPTQQVPVVRQRADGTREWVEMRWGLVPRWAKDPSIGVKMINARAETIAEKPSFRTAFRHHRCLIPADGFYEWTATAGGKQPVHVGRKDGAPFGFAGLFERWLAPRRCSRSIPARSSRRLPMSCCGRFTSACR